MEKFIQRVLSCSNIRENSNLVETFPIISVKYLNDERRLLLFRFTNNGLPNYAVLGLLKKDFVFDKRAFLQYLASLYALIMYRPNGEVNKHYLDLLDSFKHSMYFDQILYSQEGFDLINGKQYFTIGGIINRTILISCHVNEDRTILFDNDMKFDEYNKFLDGDFFRDYADYEKNYFLNYAEYHTMSYFNVLDYVRFNSHRLVKKGKLDKLNDTNYLIQLLDFHIANDLAESLDQSPFKR